MKTVTVSMESLAEVVGLQLNNGGRASLVVTGCSMMPMLRHRRDLVILIPASGQQKKGEIILYRRANGAYVLHRIIAVSEEGYICSGDNQNLREPVQQDQLVAVVEGFIRKGKYYRLDQIGYRLYTAAMVELFPLRRYYIAIRRRLGHLRSRYRRKRNTKHL